MDDAEQVAAQAYFDELASDVAASLRNWIRSIRSNLSPGCYLWVVNDTDTVRFGDGGASPPARRGRGGAATPEMVHGGTFELEESTLYQLLNESFSSDQLTQVCMAAAAMLISELDLWSMHWVTGSDRRPNVSTNSILQKTELARAVRLDDKPAIESILAATTTQWNEVSATGMFNIACASGNFEEMERWRTLGAAITEDPRQLALAAGNLDVALVQWLLEKGADPRVLDRNRSALHHSLASGEHDERVTKIVELLLVAGADPNVPDPQYATRTPLMQVATYGPISAAQPLLAAGATICGTDARGLGVVDIAVESRRFEFLPILQAHGASVTPAQQLLARAFAAHREERFADIAQLAGDLLESWPEKPEAQILALNALCKTGKSLQAVPLGLAALAQNFNENVMSVVVLAYAKLGEFNGAQQLWQTYRDRLDATAFAPLIVGNLLHIYAANDQSQRAYRELLPWVESREPEVSPDYALLCFNGACTYAQLHESENSVRLLRQARIAGYPLQQIEDEHDLAPIRGHLLYAALVSADDPSTIRPPERTISAEMAEYELGRLLERTHAEAAREPSKRVAALLSELGALIRRPTPFVEQLEAQLLECFELWQSSDHAPDYDKPLAAVLLQWPGSETMPFGSSAMSYGFASLKLPAQLHLGRPRFGGLLFEDLGEIDLAPAVQRFGDALETDNALRDCDTLESAYCFTTALLLGRACERAVKSASFSRLRCARQVYFFLQQHSQEPQLFHVATVAPSSPRRLYEN